MMFVGIAVGCVVGGQAFKLYFILLYRRFGAVNDVCFYCCWLCGRKASFKALCWPYCIPDLVESMMFIGVAADYVAAGQALKLYIESIVLQVWCIQWCFLV